MEVEYPPNPCPNFSTRQAAETPSAASRRAVFGVRPAFYQISLSVFLPFRRDLRLCGPRPRLELWLSAPPRQENEDNYQSANTELNET
jgi:hypothetical protein